MRTLKFFLRFAIIIVTLGVTGFFAGREILLFAATTQLKNDLKNMGVLSYRESEYSVSCKQKGGRNEVGSAVSHLQLRFSSPSEYVVEVICQYFSNDPIILKSVKLPWMVTKVPGESGAIWDPDGISGFQIGILNRYATILLDGEQIVVQQGKKPIDGNHPISICSGYGYACCDGVTQIGQGEVLSEAVDCPEQCFASCQPRPVVLRFSSDPAPDLKTKVVTISKNTPVSFFFVIDQGDAESISTQIDFGDGLNELSSEVEGLIAHTYQCQLPICEYLATVVATDEIGQASIITPVSSLKVIVK